VIMRWMEQRWGGPDLDQLIEQVESEVGEEDEPGDDEPVAEPIEDDEPE